MTDTAISPHLDVSAFKAMGSAKSRRVTVNPENLSSHTGTSSTRDCYFALPSANMGMINGQNSSLQMDVTITSQTSGLCNGSGSSLIDSMELIIGNQSVELLQNYAVFAAIVEDHQSSSRATNSHAILNGGRDSLKKGAELAANSKVRVTVPIYSAVIGTMCSQYCPAVDGIRLRITFASKENALLCETTGGGYTLSDIVLQMDYLDINPSVYSEMLAEAGGVFKIHGSGVSNFSTTSNLLVPNASLLIPARFSSVKNYFTTFRVSANIGSDTKNSCGDRVAPKIKGYSYIVDGRAYPSVPVKAHDGTSFLAGEAFSEVVKAFHATHSPDFDTVYSLANYTDAVGTDGTGSFLIALDWEESGYGQLRGLVSGMDTINSNTFLELQMTAGSDVPITIDTFAVHDLILELNMLDGSVSVSK
jgi:hypothetical protein